MQLLSRACRQSLKKRFLGLFSAIVSAFLGLLSKYVLRNAKTMAKKTPQKSHFYQLTTRPKTLTVGARSSPLSKIQVDEVYFELKEIEPDIIFQPIFIKTMGDCDKKTSLRGMDKTNFFTDTIDQMVLSGECRVAIHSAKDLPDPLPRGLALAALTKGVDPSDSLVLRQGEQLPATGVVATSSERRELSVKELFPQARFVDIRGTIGERLAKLDTREVDGVVVAEAALIRLQLTALNRIRLPGKTAPLQGRLAVIIREDDEEMRTLFQPLNYDSLFRT